MGIDWEQILDVDSRDLAAAYDETASEDLYHDHPRTTPPGTPVDQCYETVDPIPEEKQNGTDDDYWS